MITDLPPVVAPAARLLIRLSISLGSSVPALDSWTKSPRSIERRFFCQAGEVTSCVSRSTLAFDRSRRAFTDFRFPLPLLPNCASLPASFGSLSSAWPRIDLRFPLNAVAPSQPATKLQLLRNFASPCHAEDGIFRFPSNLTSRGSRREAVLRLLSNLSSSCEAGNVLSNSLLATN